MQQNKTLIPWLRAARDFFLPFLPSWFVCKIVRRYDFAFIAHPLVLEDLSRQYPNLNGIKSNVLKMISRYLWPVLGSEITGAYDKSGKEITGIVLFCPMSTRLLILRRSNARRKILRIVKIAEKLQVKIIGLGAYIPIVMHDGKLLAKHTSLDVTTGTSFSAVIACTNALRLAEKCQLIPEKVTVAIIGAGGSVGTICTRLMMDHFNKFILIDKRHESLYSFLKSDYLKDVSGKIMCLSNRIKDVRNADVVIVTTNTPGIILRSEHLSPGTIIVDAAQPRNVSAKVPIARKDVLVAESGVAVVPGLDTHFEFDLRTSNEVYSCLAEVLILLKFGMTGKQVGKFSLEYINFLRQNASAIGFDIPNFRNGCGVISEADCDRVKSIIVHRQKLGLEQFLLQTKAIEPAIPGIRFVKLPL